MEYGRIVKRALEITWKHKVLWIFGVAAALFGAGRGGGYNKANGLHYVFGGADLERWQRAMPMIPPRTPWMPRFGLPFPAWQGMLPMALGLLMIALVIGLALLILGIIARYTSLGALVGMVNEVEEAERTSFHSGLRQGWARMGRLLAIDLLLGLGVFAAVLVLLVLIVAGALIAIGPAVGLSQITELGGLAKALGILWGVVVGLGFLLVLILLILALAAVVTLIREFAFRACVLEKKGVFEALEAGFGLLYNRSREALLMWLVLLGINLLIGLVLIPLALLGGVGGLLGPVFLAFRVSRSWPMAMLAAIPFLLVLIPLSILIGGVYLTFQSAVWTLTYRELREGKPLGG